MKNSKQKTFLKYITRAGIIAALYAALTLVFYPIAFGSIQFRISEILTILPLFFPEAVGGLFVGCIISNLFSSNIVILDVVFGSLATLAAAYATSKMRNKWLAPLPPVLFNAIVVGLLITISSSGVDAFYAVFAYNFITVGAGQAIVCYGMGVPLIYILNKTKLSNWGKV